MILSMSGKHKDQAGFTIFEAALILIIVSLIAGTAWYVLHAKQQANKVLDKAAATSQTSNPSKSKNTATKSQKYLVINEWGVRAKYDTNLTIEYHFANGDGDKYARFSSAQLDASGPICNQGKDYGGLIERYLSSEHYVLGDGGEDFGQTAAQHASTLQNNEYGHVNNYYYFYSHPQAACSDSPSGQDIQSQTQSVVKTMVPVLEAIPQ
jgi:hypothetical protein